MPVMVSLVPRILLGTMLVVTNLIGQLGPSLDIPQRNLADIPTVLSRIRRETHAFGSHLILSRLITILTRQLFRQ